MAISDSIPERRNLILLSVSIIIFFLAGGNITDQVVRIQVINVTFSKPEILGYFVWISLFWFCYRYWLLQQGTWKDAYRNELVNGDCVFVFYKHLIKKYGLTNDFTKSQFPDKHFLQLMDSGNDKKLQFRYIYKDGSGQQKIDVKDVQGIKDYFYILLCIVYLFIRKPTLSTYFVPYFLFCFAIVLGVINAL
ncbi:MAG: hypothetical protein ACJAS1_007451 [Oleiphilaceae bacterium]|jgi:hypothetical protein